MRTIGMAMAVLAAAAGAASAAQAQDAVYWRAPSAAATGRQAYFPMGTPLRLATRIQLSSRDNKPGDRFYLTVAEPLVYQGQVVVPAGAQAVGEVMRADGSAMFGKRGQMAVRLLHVQTPSGPIALTGRADRAGKGQEVLAIAGGLLVWTPMFLIRGTSARLPADSVVTAYLAEDLPFAVAPIPLRTVAMADAESVVPARFDPTAFSGVRVR